MTASGCRRTSPKPTVVFDALWLLAAERQRIYFRRLAGEPPPWSDDPILQSHRFTNAYRVSDRASQFLIDAVQGQSSATLTDRIARTVLFKVFNKPETWERVESSLGPVGADCLYDSQLVRTLDDAFGGGATLYSAAYIMPSPQRGQPRKHQNHIDLLATMGRKGVWDRLAEAHSLRALFELLRSWPSFGDFLAYQFAIDLNYLPEFSFSEMEFIVPGPGALEGITKCFSDAGDHDPSALIEWTTETQADHLERLGIDFPSLFGRELMLIDVQNLFCEVAKYSRAAFPQFTAEGGRKRLKRRFEPRAELPDPVFPPAWGLDQAVEAWRTDRRAA